ncbi:hypothetical protein DL765_007588 [Monosporascus sp. GIB2]|nr:hypothetical protein DL765_007588 [Monosporascus sp. GIB2]
MVQVVRDESRFSTALSKLRQIKFARLTEDSVILDVSVAKLLEKRLEEPLWRTESVKIVSHVFPKLAIKPESYWQQCEELLPSLKRVFSYLVHSQELSLLEPVCLVQLAETSSSASYFGDYACKSRALETGSLALRALEDNSPDKEYLAAMLLSRKAWLAYLYRPSRQIEWQSLRTSRQIFQALAPSPQPEMLFDKIDRLSILLGLAVGYHPDGQVDAAFDAWNKALSMSQSFLTPGYTDLIISYSVGELELRRGAVAQADASGAYARSLFARTGLQHHFIGLGSLWPDLLGYWYKQRGREPIIPLRN